jgi:hypothetical protein
MAARKRTSGIEDEIKRIEEEEEVIESKEDVLRTLEELGLMRWKSYYILTAGAILLLALTFVTALWMMNEQLMGIQDSVGVIEGKVTVLEYKVDALSSQISALREDLQVIEDLLASRDLNLTI